MNNEYPVESRDIFHNDKYATLDTYIQCQYYQHMTFEWSPAKERENIKKHRVTFVEAKTVFSDPVTKVAHDPDHSEDEDRFFAVGYSEQGRLLLVVHCFREKDEVIRIISARKVTKKERKDFEENI